MVSSALSIATIAAFPTGYSEGNALTGLTLSPLLGVMTEWLPIWATPIFAISVGLLLGAIVAIAFYGVLALLSFIPPLGKLADSSNRFEHIQHGGAAADKQLA